MLAEYGPYFTETYRTPWGAALNFDAAGSDDVRRFFVENACWWTEDCHVDGLRLDAVHAIVDPTARPFVQQLTETVHERAERIGRRVTVIAESAANDAHLIKPVAAGGKGCDAQWSDDFHHALHATLTGERDGYYADYGSLDDLADAYTRGWVYDGRFSSFRDRTFGSDPSGIPGRRFVVCAQNHDQIGNRARGERLGALVDAGGVLVAAAAVLLAPYVPMLFMGEEYGDPAPFPYFVSHTDPELVEAVRRGRAQEFSAVAGGEPPDPQAGATFASAVLRRELRHDGVHRTLHDWHRELLALRRTRPALARPDLRRVRAVPHREVDALTVRRWRGSDHVTIVFHLAPGDVVVPLPDARRHAILLDSGAARFDGRHEAAMGDAGLRLHGLHAVVLAVATP